MPADFPDFVKGSVIVSGALPTLMAQDFPDWTDGYVQIAGPITPGEDFPDWTKTLEVDTAVFPGPGSITGLFAWYDATQISGVADGAPLASWPDLSGNGFTLSQATAALRPVYYNATGSKLVNKRPAVWFTQASSQTMATAAFATPVAQPVTVYCVARPSSTSPQGGVMFDNTAEASPFLLGANVTTWLVAASTGVNFGSQDAHLHAFNVVLDGTHNDSTAMVDATGYTPGATGNTNLAGITVGSSRVPDTYMDGPLCELLFYAAKHTPTQVASVMGYLKTKWGTP